MADRKAELERKKARLAQMRVDKKRKEDERKKKEDSEIAAAKQASSKSDLRSETEELLKDLGIPPTGTTTAPAVPTPSTSDTKQDKDRGDVTVPTPVVHPSPRTAKRLQVSQVTQTNIAPRETVTYAKETQTPHEVIDREVLSFHDNYLDDDADSMEVAVHTPPSHKMPQVELVQPHATQEDTAKKEPELKDLSEEEKLQIIISEDFQKFFDRSTRIIERALDEEDSNIFIDYSGANEDQEGDTQLGERLKVNREFFDDRWSKNRTVTSIDWSTQYPELVVASYSANDDTPHEPDGVALIWNVKFKKTTPEYIFHCQSAVMSACFAKFHPNLVVGGTYSGQIVLWDNRSNRRTPVQRTPLSSAAHTHPVYCINVVGTQNAHNLISVSSDGKMCSWSLDMLSQPQDSMELQHKQPKSVAATSFSFFSGDVNNFVVGSEEGAVFTACRHGSKAGIGEMFEGHQGPITGIDTNSVTGQIDFSHYFLTSSVDWTIKLWNAKEAKPLYSFEDNNDYILDVKWSPIHPALFASVDCMGRLDVWNLNNDTEVPTASMQVDPNIALNKCRWHSSGHQIAVGDDVGKIHIFDVGESIANPRIDDWSKFVHTLQEIKTNTTEAEDDTFSSISH